MKKQLIIALSSVAILILTATSSCKKYLDAPSDKSLVIPTKIKELRGLLDNETMFINYISISDLSNDNMYMLDNDWLAQGSYYKPNQDADI